MPRYQTKPIIRECIQWTGDNIDDVSIFVPQSTMNMSTKTLYLSDGVARRNANKCCGIGDWIIEHENQYSHVDYEVIRDEDFHKVYEPVLRPVADSMLKARDEPV